MYIYGVPHVVHNCGLLWGTQRRPTLMQELVSHVIAGCPTGQADGMFVGADFKMT